MMHIPEELFILAVFSVLIFGIIVVTWLTTGYLKSRNQSNPGPELTASQLRELIGEAIREETVPLDRRLQEIEQLLQTENRAKLREPDESSRQLTR